MHSNRFEQNKFCTPRAKSQNKFGTKIKQPSQNKFGTKIKPPSQNKFCTPRAKSQNKFCAPSQVIAK
jgi:hypothetical protein